MVLVLKKGKEILSHLYICIFFAELENRSWGNEPSFGTFQRWSPKNVCSQRRRYEICRIQETLGCYWWNCKRLGVFKHGQFLDSNFVFVVMGHSITKRTRWGGRGSEMSVFVHTQGIRTVNARGGGSKIDKLLST